MPPPPSHPGEIRPHNLRRPAAADLRLRPRGHWDRLSNKYTKRYLTVPLIFQYWLACRLLFLLVFLILALWLNIRVVYLVSLALQEWKTEDVKVEVWTNKPPTFLCFRCFQRETKISGLLRGVVKSQQSNDDHLLSVLDFGSSQRYRWISRSSGVTFHSTFLFFY